MDIRATGANIYIPLNSAQTQSTAMQTANMEATNSSQALQPQQDNNGVVAEISKEGRAKAAEQGPLSREREIELRQKYINYKQEIYNISARFGGHLRGHDAGVGIVFDTEIFDKLIDMYNEAKDYAAENVSAEDMNDYMQYLDDSYNRAVESVSRSAAHSVSRSVATAYNRQSHREHMNILRTGRVKSLYTHVTSDITDTFSNNELVQAIKNSMKYYGEMAKKAYESGVKFNYENYENGSVMSIGNIKNISVASVAAKHGDASILAIAMKGIDTSSLTDGMKSVLSRATTELIGIGFGIMGSFDMDYSASDDFNTALRVVNDYFKKNDIDTSTISQLNDYQKFYDNILEEMAK
jgi:hypothetical protein